MQFSRIKRTADVATAAAGGSGSATAALRASTPTHTSFRKANKQNHRRQNSRPSSRPVMLAGSGGAPGGSAACAAASLAGLAGRSRFLAFLAPPFRPPRREASLWSLNRPVPARRVQEGSRQQVVNQHALFQSSKHSNCSLKQSPPAPATGAYAHRQQKLTAALPSWLQQPLHSMHKPLHCIRTHGLAVEAAQLGDGHHLLRRSGVVLGHHLHRTVRGVHCRGRAWGKECSQMSG